MNRKQAHQQILLVLHMPNAPHWAHAPPTCDMKSTPYKAVILLFILNNNNLQISCDQN